MDNRILKDSRYADRIRSKMGVSSPYLPDEDIKQPDIVTIAESNIISQFPDYETFTGDLVVYLESIVVLECCVLLSSSMSARLPKKQTGPHEGHELWINWDNKKAEFINEQNSLIGRLGDLINPNNGTDYFKSFIATFPKRGW